MVAQVAQVHPAGQRATGERLRLRREQHLPAVGRGGDPRRPVDVEPDVVVATASTVAGMHPDADLDDGALRPGRGGEGALDRDRCTDGAGGCREDHEERIALGADLHAVPGGDRRPDQLGLPLEQRGVRVPERLEKARGPLDVAEQEGDGAGRQVRPPRDCLGAGHALATIGGVTSPSPSPASPPASLPLSGSSVIGSDGAFSRRARKTSGSDSAEIAAATRYEAP